MNCRQVVVLLSALSLGTGAALAGTPPAARPAGLSPDYRAEGDGPVTMAIDPSGRMWAVWAYAQGGEFDVAVSVSDGRVWTYPTLLGVANGRNDVDPRIAFLPNGAPVVVWWQEATATHRAQVLQSVARAETFAPPTVVREGARQPAILSATGGSLTLGLVDEEGMVQTMSSPTSVDPRWREKPSPDGGTNGPDPMPALIVKPPDAQHKY
ncbi:MAG: hypothetical protein MUC67_10695 [Acidobacteria bacterium]|jgi:hypothetical protein|nr:hypothetical protein [Acidobacteriota bacterium]